jgi:hypothetical protein
MHTCVGDIINVRRTPNIEIRLNGTEHINCDVCQDFIMDDDAVIHVHTAEEYGGLGLMITHIECAKEVKERRKDEEWLKGLRKYL